MRPPSGSGSSVTLQPSPRRTGTGLPREGRGGRDGRSMGERGEEGGEVKRPNMYMYVYTNGCQMGHAYSLMIANKLKTVYPGITVRPHYE